MGKKKVTKKELDKKIRNQKEIIQMLMLINVVFIILIVALSLSYKACMEKDTPQTLDYEHCKDQYEYGGYIGELCCVNDPDTTLQNKCAFYYKRGELNAKQTN